MHHLHFKTIFPIGAVTKCINFHPIFVPLCHLLKKYSNSNVFSQIATSYKNHEWLCERVILAEKNNDVNAINNIIQGQILGQYKTYKSIGTIMDMDEIVIYPIEFFNSMDIPGISQHVLSLKIGARIILFRNFNPTRMRNGTRVAVK